MTRQGRRMANGTRIPWNEIDPTLRGFAHLRRVLPHKRGRGAPVEGSAPSPDEIAQAYNNTVLKRYHISINGAHILQRLLRHHDETPQRQRSEKV